MHLESLTDQVVTIQTLDKQFSFVKGETIHTENSYKYAPQEFEALLRAAGFSSVTRWDSPDVGYFVFYAA